MKYPVKEMKVLNTSKRNTPVILNSFAPENGNYGFIWKIYIEAEDPNGEMEKIAAIVDQTGYGYYPTDWIILKPHYRKHFIGYLQWNTFSSKGSHLAERTQITLKVSIFNQAGKESDEVVFPFTFESGGKNQYPNPLPPPFDKGNIPRLGYIMIDLYCERI